MDKNDDSIEIEVDATNPLSTSLVKLHDALKAFDEEAPQVNAMFQILNLLHGSAQGRTISGPAATLEDAVGTVDRISALAGNLHAELRSFLDQWKLEPSARE